MFARDASEQRGGAERPLSPRSSSRAIKEWALADHLVAPLPRVSFGCVVCCLPAASVPADAAPGLGADASDTSGCPTAPAAPPSWTRHQKGQWHARSHARTGDSCRKGGHPPLPHGRPKRKQSGAAANSARSRLCCHTRSYMKGPRANTCHPHGLLRPTAQTHAARAPSAVLLLRSAAASSKEPRPRRHREKQPHPHCVSPSNTLATRKRAHCTRQHLHSLASRCPNDPHRAQTPLLPRTPHLANRAEPWSRRRPASRRRLPRPACATPRQPPECIVTRARNTVGTRRAAARAVQGPFEGRSRAVQGPFEGRSRAVQGPGLRRAERLLPRQECRGMAA
eukprot:6190797-Pleurochrysis_carterae.AAC.2